MKNQCILKSGDYENYLDSPDIIIQADFSGLKRRSQRHLKRREILHKGGFLLLRWRGPMAL